MALRVAMLSLFALRLAVVPAMAQQIIYDNGPINGTSDAWPINFGFAVSDSFVLSNSQQVNGLEFGAWLFPGDVLESVEVSITSNAFGGTTYFDATVNFTQSGCATNQFGFNVCLEQSTAFSGPVLDAGNYWLNFQNAVVNTGDPVYWDENDGPSMAQNSVGSIPSESFTILGGSGTTSTSTTPEPSSVLLFGSGVLGLADVLRRKRS